jgi:hypothetical protein
VDPKTVRRYVAARDEARPVTGPARRPRIIDPYLAKIEEWVDRSQGKVRADIVHERLEGVGFGGMSAPPAARWRRRRRRGAPVIGASAVGRRAGAAAALRLGQRSGGAGPGWAGAGDVAVLRVAGVVTGPGRDPELGRKLGTLLACLDGTPRRLGGVPTYALTDNEKTVTVENLAGVSVRHPAVVAAGRHYGVQVHTCVPFDPESKVGSEATVRIAKADLVSTEANLLAGYDSFADLAGACEAFCAQVNGRVHRKTGRVPADAVELDALVGTEPVDAALEIAAAAGRFADGVLLAIVEHCASGAPIAELVVADETHSVQPGTAAWKGFSQ